MSEIDPRNIKESLKNAAYAAKLLRLHEERARQTGPGGLMHFCRYFWKVLEPGTDFIDGWAMQAVAEHLEAVTFGELNRLLVNVPPGFSKSLLTNTWWPAWEWGPMNMAHLRGLSFSYAAHLTERDNDRLRTLITSKPYQELWGDRFKITGDAKIKISNDKMGWCLASSVRGVTTGERADRVRCFPYNTLVATERGPIKIGKIVTHRMPVKVWSRNIETGKVGLQPISAWRHNPGAKLVRVEFCDGSSIWCTPDHRIWTSSGWVEASLLQSGDMIPCSPAFNVADRLLPDAISAPKLSRRNTSAGFEYLHNLPVIKLSKSLLGSSCNAINVAFKLCNHSFSRNISPDLSFSDRKDCRFVNTKLFFKGWARVFGFKNIQDFLFGKFGARMLLSAFGNKLTVARWVSISKASARPFWRQIQFEMTPAASSHDIGDGARTNSVFRRQLCVGQFAFGNDLTHKVLGQMGSAIAKIPMIFAVSNVICSRSVFKVIKSRIASVSVLVPNFLAFWAWAKKCFGHHLVNHFINGLAVQSQCDARVALVEGPSHKAAPACERFSIFSNGFSSLTKDTSKVRDFVKFLKAKRWTPDFVSVVSVENFGQVTDTFCLTIQTNHTFEVIPSQGKNTYSISCANCDDGHNISEGESERVRSETVRWFKESMSNRLNNMEKSAIVVIMQRVHELDISGAIIEDPQGMGYEHLCIPMRYEVDGPWSQSTKIGWHDPRTIDGELAWPERFPAKVVDNLERDLGPWAFASQYMQSPAPRGGGIIKRNWFRLWEDKNNKFPPFINIVAAVDPAYTEKDENDPSAMAIFATFRHPETNEFGIMLVHCWRKRLPIHGDTSPRFPGESAKAYERRCGDDWGLVEWIWHCCEAYGVHQLIIEGKASGLSVFQEIERRQSLRSWACEIDTGKNAGDKVNRLTSVQPIFSQGLVWAPDRDWADMFINEITQFPKGKHDDLTDCSSSALRRMREMGLIQHTDEREYDEYVEQNRPQALQPLYPV